jgi:hypothetical protein
MNIQELKSIINSGLPDEVVKSEIFKLLARDEFTIPIILNILQRERDLNKEIIEEMNQLLSKAHIGLGNRKFNRDNFMQKEIADFYIKYKDHVSHCFKIDGL